MKKSNIVTLFALIVIALFALPVTAQVATHSVWTNLNGYYIIDATNGCQYTSFGSFNMATSWNETFAAPNPADAHFRGVGKAATYTFFCPTRFYDFRLVASTVTKPDSITGTWDIYRGGALMCSSCTGSVQGLSAPAGVGNYYKLYIDDPIFGPGTWGYIGYIDQRKDF
jgi:hypothetical protein